MDAEVEEGWLCGGLSDKNQLVSCLSSLQSYPLFSPRLPSSGLFQLEISEAYSQPEHVARLG